MYRLLVQWLELSKLQCTSVSLWNTQDVEVLLVLQVVYRRTTLIPRTISLVCLYKLQMTDTWFDGIVCDRYKTHTGFLERSILLMIYLCLVGTWGMKIVILYEICPLEEKGLGYENVKWNWFQLRIWPPKNWCVFVFKRTFCNSCFEMYFVYVVHRVVSSCVLLVVTSIYRCVRKVKIQRSETSTTFLTLILPRSRTGTVWFYTLPATREQHDQNCTQSH